MADEIREEPTEISTEAALVGLIGWLAAREAHASPIASSAAATVRRLERAIAHRSQMGYFDETGPFLAYPGRLW